MFKSAVENKPVEGDRFPPGNKESENPPLDRGAMGDTEDCGAERKEANLETYLECINRKKTYPDHSSSRSKGPRVLWGPFRGLPVGQVPEGPVKCMIPILYQGQGAALSSLTGALPALPI